MASARSARGSVYLAEDDDLMVEVLIEGVGVVDEVPQDEKFAPDLPHRHLAFLASRSGAPTSYRCWRISL